MWQWNELGLFLNDSAGRRLWRVEIEADGESRPLLPDQKTLSFGNGVSLDVRAVEASSRLDALQLTLQTTGEQPIDSLAVVFRPEENDLLRSETRLMVLGDSVMAGQGASALGGEARDRIPCMGCVLKSGSQAFLAGVGGPASDFAFARIDRSSFMLGYEIERKTSREESYTVLCGSGEALELMERYGEALGGRPAGRPTGWNSWDYYAGSIRMGDVRAEMEAINASPLKGRLQYICIDMGWENMWGDWRPNRKFPGSLAAIASEIRQAGFEPGIWTAPLQAGTYLPLVRHRRDLFCQGPQGEPIIAEGNGSCLLFDPTHPDTAQMLYDTYKAMRDAGFLLFKVDYIYRNYFDWMTGFADAEAGKAAAARRFLEIVRQAVGEEAHILSCGVPYQSALGLADSARVSTDIHNFWGHIRNSAVQVSASFWSGGRTWANDPDFALARCAATSDDPFPNPPYNRRPLESPSDFWLAGPEASLAELQTWLAVVALTGGSVFFSDSIARLNAEGIDLCRRLLGAACPPARPLDLFENTPPRLWQAEGDGHRWLGLFNWDDVPCRLEEMAAGSLPRTAQNIWTGESIVLTPSLEIPPHGCVFVKE